MATAQEGCSAPVLVSPAPALKRVEKDNSRGTFGASCHFCGGLRRRAPSAEAYLGLGDMYVADPRFAQHYGGADGAAYVREAMRVYARNELA